MWGVVLLLIGARAIGFFVRGGPVLWLSLLVGLAVLGGNPDDPGSAAFATVGALTLLTLVRALTAEHLRR